MRSMWFVPMSLLLGLSLNMYGVKKDTQIILDEIQKLTDNVSRLEQKVTILSTEWSSLNKRLEALENRIVAMVTNQADSNEKRENLVLGMQFLREELTDIKNGLGTIQNQLLSAIPPAVQATNSAIEESSDPGAGVKPAPESIESIYYTAYSDYIKQDYDLAINGFRQFVEKYPTSTLADNSLYWVGECYYAQKKFNEAVTTFTELIERFRDGDKIADASLKKGFALIEMGRQSEGISVLRELISRFPLSEEASLAQQKMKEVKE